MFTLTKEPFSVYFSSNTRHNHLAGAVKAPKGFPYAAQINLPSELFETVDIDVRDTDFDNTYACEELSQRTHDVQGLLTRLRPYLPIPYLAELGLTPPVLGIRGFEKGTVTPLGWVTQQTFKLPDFMGSELEKCLQRNNTGPLSITLEQMDMWGLDRLKIEQIKRCRPLIVCTNGQSSMWNQRATILEPTDMMSMKAQVSIIKWVARKTQEAYRYRDPSTLIGVYSNLWISGDETEGGGRLKQAVIDPFELEGGYKRLTK